jgi:hypothetical protein
LLPDFAANVTGFAKFKANAEFTLARGQSSQKIETRSAKIVLLVTAAVRISGVQQ